MFRVSEKWSGAEKSKGAPRWGTHYQEDHTNYCKLQLGSDQHNWSVHRLLRIFVKWVEGYAPENGTRGVPLSWKNCSARFQPFSETLQKALHPRSFSTPSVDSNLLIATCTKSDPHRLERKRSVSLQFIWQTNNNLKHDSDSTTTHRSTKAKLAASSAGFFDWSKSDCAARVWYLMNEVQHEQDFRHVKSRVN